MTGKMPGVAIQDYAHARMIVLWGVNPSVSGIHLLPYVQDAVRRGAKLVVIDPRRTKLAEQADLHLALQPGSDLPVALSVIRWLFETGRAASAFLAEHTTGAEELTRRASPWTFERAARSPVAARTSALRGVYADAVRRRCAADGAWKQPDGGSAIAAICPSGSCQQDGVRGGGYDVQLEAFDMTAGRSGARPSAARST
jgi:anaerobic selenocysteine-containing dehydrogenase